MVRWCPNLKKPLGPYKDKRIQAQNVRDASFVENYRGQKSQKK